MDSLLFLVCLSAFITTVWSLDCYQCQTLAGKGCDDPFNHDDPQSASFLGECDEGTYCVKYKTVVKIRDSGYINGWERHSVAVTRACEAPDGKSQGCTGWQNNGGITIKCFCASDGCNAGSSLTMSRHTFVVASTVGVVLALARRLV